jgi:hypothetical protein
MSRDDYIALRRRYQPESVRLIIVAESPPASGRYFYDPTGAPSEPLFAALMRHLGLSPSTKEEGLREFQRAGWLLVDATYQPVDALKGVKRDAVIIRDYPLLRDDLANFGRSTPLVLLKVNVRKILEPKRTAEGFNVLNRDRAIYFPSHGRQPDFAQQFAAVLEWCCLAYDHPRNASSCRRASTAPFQSRLPQIGSGCPPGYSSQLPTSKNGQNCPK